MLSRIALPLTVAGVLGIASNAAADIIHVIPASSPGPTQTFSPLPGGPPLSVQIGLPWPLHSLLASTGEPTVAWLVWQQPEPTPDVPPIGEIPQVVTLDLGQPVGESAGAWGGGGQVNLYGWLPDEDPAGPFFIEPLLGFRAHVDNDWSYGWVRLRCHFFSNGGGGSWDRGWNPIDIVDYAYEASLGVPIPAGAIPSPGAAALVALAGAGLHRRRRS